MINIFILAITKVIAFLLYIDIFKKIIYNKKVTNIGN